MSPEGLPKSRGYGDKEEPTKEELEGSRWCSRRKRAGCVVFWKCKGESISETRKLMTMPQTMQIT